jgi:hypothetical protein
MSKTFLNSAKVACLVAAVAFAAACKFGGAGDSGSTNPEASLTLAQQVVNELGNNLASADIRAAVSSDSITAIKAAALAKIEADGNKNSDKLDKILPSMIAGVEKYASDSSLTAERKADLFKESASSAIGSLGKDTRKASISSSVTLDSAVGLISAAAVKAAVDSIGNANSADVDAAKSAVASIAETTVKLVTVNTVYSNVKSAAISASVSQTVSALSATSGTTIELKDVVASLVSGTVNACVTTTGLDSTTMIKLTISAAVSAPVSSGSANAADLAKAAVTGAATGVANSSSTDAVALITAAAGQAAATVVATGASVNGDDLQAAVSSGLAVATTTTTITVDVTSTVTEVLSETAPVITDPTANWPKGSKTITLSVTPAEDTKYTYAWTQTAGPAVTITDSSKSTATAAVSASGTYAFSVVVTNKGKYMSSSKDVSITVDFSSQVSKDAVTAGINALKTSDYDAALTKFTAAYAADKTNVDARFWLAVMKLAATSTDSKTVNLVKNRIGFVDYPSSMNELFSHTWFKQSWYGTERGFVKATIEDDDRTLFIKGNIVPDTDGYDSCEVYKNGSWFWYNNSTFKPSESGEFYCDYYTIDTNSYSSWNNNLPIGATKYVRKQVLDPSYSTLLPRLEVPSWASNFIGSEVGNETSSMPAMSSYYPILLCNVISKNPAGLNTFLDEVLSGPFGSNFDSIVSLINGLPDTAAITIPADLVSDSDGSDIVVRKGELKASLASLEMTKSFLQFLASYNLNYPITVLQSELWTSSGTSAMLSKLLAQKNPIAAGFFGNRSDATRSAAKDSMLAALGDIKESIDLISTELEDLASVSSKVKGEMFDADVSEAQTQLSRTKDQVGILMAAIVNGSTLYVNLSGDSISDILSAVPGTQKYAFVPAKLYSTDILNPAKIFETSSTGLKIYGATTDSDTPVLAELGSKPSDLSSKKYFDLRLRVKMDRVKEIMPVMSGTLPKDSVGNSCLILPSNMLDDEDSGSPYQVLPDAWNVIDWIN